jgi:hypothetical protein
MEDAMARKPSETINLRVRMPEALRTTIAVEAAKAGRSLNSEILYRLGLTLDEKWQRFVAGIENEEKKVAELRERVINSPEMMQIVNKLIERDRSSKGLKER